MKPVDRADQLQPSRRCGLLDCFITRSEDVTDLLAHAVLCVLKVRLTDIGYEVVDYCIDTRNLITRRAPDRINARHDVLMYRTWFIFTRIKELDGELVSNVSEPLGNLLAFERIPFRTIIDIA